MTETSDEQLISQYLNGDEKSLAILIQRHLKPIYNFVYRYTNNGQEAEDITQEVFLKVFKNIKKYNPQKNFRSWIFSIAKNACIDFFKKKKDVPFSAFDNEEGENIIADTISDPSPLPPEILERADAANILNEAVAKLPPIYRVVLFSYYQDSLNFREISELLDEPIDTTKSRHRRALIMLKKILK